MTVEINTFNSLELAKTETENRLGQWRVLHYDFIYGKFRVTFVNGDDDPNNSPEVENRRIIFERRKELSAKLEDDSITFGELKEHMRLSL